jgi:hypothetical protein
MSSDRSKIDKPKIDKPKIDKNGELEGSPFSYRALKNGSVLLEHHGRTVKTISGDEAERFFETHR